MKYIFYVLFLVSLSLNLSAKTMTEADVEEGGWKKADGTRVENTDAEKSVGGFGGKLLITSDADWEEKWNTPEDHTPSFTTASEVRLGEELTILTFYVNPKVNKQGYIDIRCDIKLTRPDGSVATDAKDFECATGEFHGNPYNVRLTNAIIKYIGEEGDVPGEWSVFVLLKDKIRGVEMPLKTSFILKAEE